MSYIGKNPEADSIKLKGSATEPSGTSVDGQVYFNTGTGSISKGMKVYKNSQFVAIDKQLGDADTMQLLKAADIPAIDFNLSYTSTTVGGNNAVPFESSTGDFDGTAAFSNSSTGDALLTDDSDDLVFHYTTQATNSADNDFWGIPLTVPRAFRGGNLVLEFKYRTEIATGTMDNGYFNIAIQDRSAMILQTQASTISAGAIAAGSNVLLTGKTYSNPVTSTTLTVAVGDRVFVESGTGTAGSQTNDIVDCYITEVSSTDNNVKLSKDIVAVQNGKFVTGWLTGYDTGGQIDAFASDTNKDGTSKKLAFKTDADTQQVSLWFFVKGTSTVKHELFFDNVLLSANKFLQASSQTQSESYITTSASSFWKGTGTSAPYTFNTTNIVPSGGSPTLAQSKLVQIADITGPGTYGTVTAIKAKEKIKLDVAMAGHSTASSGNNIINSDGYNIGYAYHGTSYWANVAASIVLEKDDYVFLKCENNSSAEGAVTFTATPQTSPVVLLESQDEIFTDWQEYSMDVTAVSSNPTKGTNTFDKALWRRVGDTMQIRYDYVQTGAGTNGSGIYKFPLPSGYSMDTTRLDIGSTTAHSVIGRAKVSLNADGWTNYSNYACIVIPYDSTNMMVKYHRNSGDNMYMGGFSLDGAGMGFGNTTVSYSFQIEVPIQGWNSNFNPLLSMPLQDFSSLENTFSATISSTGAISSQSANFIASATKDSTGVYSVVFTSGFFNAAPSIVGTVIDNNRVFGITSGPTSSGFTYKINVSGTLTDASVDLIVVRKASDFRQAPQTTAAVIKPAVAVLRDKKANNVGAGSILASSGWQDMILNTMSGETWFVTLSGTGTTGVGGTNVDFTLEAGTYEMVAQFTLYNCNAYRTRLVDSAGTVIAISSSEDAYANQGYMPGHSWVMDTFTITSSTEFTFQTDVESNGDLGVPTNMGYDEIYSQVMIRKLK